MKKQFFLLLVLALLLTYCSQKVESLDMFYSETLNVVNNELISQFIKEIDNCESFEELCQIDIETDKLQGKNGRPIWDSGLKREIILEKGITFSSQALRGNYGARFIVVEGGFNYYLTFKNNYESNMIFHTIELKKINKDDKVVEKLIFNSNRDKSYIIYEGDEIVFFGDYFYRDRIEYDKSEPLEWFIKKYNVLLKPFKIKI